MWPYLWHQPVYHHSGCQCWRCRPAYASTSSTFTFTTVQRCESFESAIAHAELLRKSGIATVKPKIKREMDRWVVRWVPRCYTYNTAASV